MHNGRTPNAPKYGVYTPLFPFSPAGAHARIGARRRSAHTRTPTRTHTHTGAPVRGCLRSDFREIIGVYTGILGPAAFVRRHGYPVLPKPRIYAEHTGHIGIVGVRENPGSTPITRGQLGLFALCKNASNSRRSRLHSRAFGVRPLPAKTRQIVGVRGCILGPSAFARVSQFIGVRGCTLGPAAFVLHYSADTRG